MRTMRTIRTMLTAAMVMGAAAIVAAQPPAGGMPGGRMGQPGGPGMRGMGPGGPAGNPMAALNLTPEQREKVQALQQRQRDGNREAGERLRGLNEQLREALFGDNPDAAVEIAKEVGQIEGQLLPSRVAMQAEIVKLLTPDQKKIAMELNLFGPNGGIGPGGPGGRGGQAPIKK
jgi:Spy/CpxP family protein refolding chaperone